MRIGGTVTPPIQRVLDAGEIIDGVHSIIGRTEGAAAGGAVSVWAGDEGVAAGRASLQAGDHGAFLGAEIDLYGAGPAAHGRLQIRAAGVRPGLGQVLLGTADEYVEWGDPAAAHAGGADPHPVYLTAAEGDAAVAAHAAAGNPHAVYLTAAEGDVAYDPLAVAASAAEMQAATEGAIRRLSPLRVAEASAGHLIRAAVARTLANSAAEQAIFNDPANGRVTLPLGTYLFEGLLFVTLMSATSGNAGLSLLGAGTAVTAGWKWQVVGNDANDVTVTATRTGKFVIAAGITPVVTQGTGTSLGAQLRGTFEVTTAGTLIPSITLETAIATAVVGVGSFVRFRRVGAAGLVSAGAWD